MATYIVESYAADGKHCEPRYARFATIREARAEVRRRLIGPLAPLRFKPNWPDEPHLVTVEAYHDYPATHPKAKGCGGIVIYVQD